MWIFWLLFICGHLLAIGVARLARPLMLSAQTGAAWAILSIFGSAIPVWAVILVAGASFLLGLLSRQTDLLKVVLINALFSGVLVAAGASQWGLVWPSVIALALHVAVLYAGIVSFDLGRRTFPFGEPLVRVVCVVAGAAGLFVAASILIPHLRHFAWANRHEAVPSLIVKPTYSAMLKPVEIGNGMGWVSRGAFRSRPCTLLLHGANGLGARQPAAASLTIALLEAGYRVLALDHLGFGHSPPPEKDSLESWDPTRITDAGMSYLRSENCSEIIVVGHSMGVTEALRLTRRSAFAIQTTFLFGGGLPEQDSNRDDYWYQRFHQDRGLNRSLSVSLWRDIREQYYLNETFADPNHENRLLIPIVFVEFENEFADLAITRVVLRDLLGPEFAVRFPSNHYFNSKGNADFVLMDGRAIRAVQALISDYQ